MVFKFDYAEWPKIYEKGKEGLVGKWTDVIYNSFKAQQECCPLSFKYNKLKRPRSTNRHKPFVNIRAKCMYPTCGRFYIINIKRMPDPNEPLVTVHAKEYGEQSHTSGKQIFKSIIKKYK
jgi:hypothetical protein